MGIITVPTGQITDPKFFSPPGKADGKTFWQIGGPLLTQVILDWISESRDPEFRPPEASDKIPASFLAMQGVAFGTLNRNTQITDMAMAAAADASDRAGMYSNRLSDGSLEFLIHDTMHAHVVGTATEPRIAARRAKSDMAAALQELAEVRWDNTGMHKTLSACFSEGRLRGTASVEIFRDPQTKTAASRRIPTQDLILDHTAGPELSKTKFRGSIKRIPRWELRAMLKRRDMDTLLADTAGLPFDRDMISDANELDRRDQDNVSIIDFYYDDGAGYRRHVQIAQGLQEPILDTPYWPYTLPQGLWPIVVWAANPMMVSPWGRADFVTTQQWQEFSAWALRFMSVSAAQTSKVVPVYDKSLGDERTIKRVIGDLRNSFEPVGLNMTGAMAALGQLGTIDNLIKFINVPSDLKDLTAAEEIARRYVSEVSGIADAQRADENPLMEPARLKKRRTDWSTFVSECLTVESILDIQLIPRQAHVRLSRHAASLEEGEKPPAPVHRFMILEDAERLERNLVPTEWALGVTGEQFSAPAMSEKELRDALMLSTEDNALMKDLRQKGKWEPVKVADYIMVDIMDPGIARYVKRYASFHAWEGAGATSFRADRALSEFIFNVAVHYPGEQSEQVLQRNVALLGTMQEHYTQYGMPEHIIEWAKSYQKAVSTGQDTPDPPRMLQNIVDQHNSIMRASRTRSGTVLDLRPYDYAIAILAASKQMEAQAQQEAQAVQAASTEQASAREEELKVMELELKRTIAEQKHQTELLRQQAEILRQTSEIERLRYMTLQEQAKMISEQESAPFRTMQQEYRARSSEARAARDQIDVERSAILAAKEAMSPPRPQGGRPKS